MKFIIRLMIITRMTVATFGTTTHLNILPPVPAQSSGVPSLVPGAIAFAGRAGALLMIYKAAR